MDAPPCGRRIGSNTIFTFGELRRTNWSIYMNGGIGIIWITELKLVIVCKHSGFSLVWFCRRAQGWVLTSGRWNLLVRVATMEYNNREITHDLKLTVGNVYS